MSVSNKKDMKTLNHDLSANNHVLLQHLPNPVNFQSFGKAVMFDTDVGSNAFPRSALELIG